VTRDVNQAWHLYVCADRPQHEGEPAARCTRARLELPVKRAHPRDIFGGDADCPVTLWHAEGLFGPDGIAERHWDQGRANNPAFVWTSRALVELAVWGFALFPLQSFRWVLLTSLRT